MRRHPRKETRPMKKPLSILTLSAGLLTLTLSFALAQESTPAPTPATHETKPEAKATPMEKPAATPATKSTKVAATKVSAEDIKDVQEALAKGGYYKGEATGKWDKASKTALK